MLTEDEIIKLTVRIIENYNSTVARNAGIIHPGKLFDAIKKGLEEGNEE